jgi:hypothetical protein
VPSLIEIDLHLFLRGKTISIAIDTPSTVMKIPHLALSARTRAACGETPFLEPNFLKQIAKKGNVTEALLVNAP